MKLFFDLDGTLFQTELTVLAAARTFFDELKLPYPRVEEILSHVGRPMNVFLQNIMGGMTVSNEIRQRFRTIEQVMVRRQGKLFDCVPPVLTSLKEDNHSLYICSNGSLEYIELVLSSTGISTYFDGKYSAKEYPSKSDRLREVLQGDTDAVFIGDTADDRMAARQNNLPFIAALYGYGGDGVRDKNSYLAEEPEDIYAKIRQIEAFKAISDKLHKNKRVVGINGVDTSGKTVFADGLVKYLRSLGKDAALIHIDDFHNPLAVRRNGATEIDAYYDNAFNYDQFVDELLSPLKETGTVKKDVICLDLDTDTYSKAIHYDIKLETVVIIEGVLLFRPPLLEYLDVKVFLDVSFDEVLRRAKERDVPRYGEAFLQKYIDKYIPIQQQYLGEYKPERVCNVLVDNNDYRRPFTKKV